MKANRLHIFILCLLLCCFSLESAWAEQAITVSRFNHVEYREALASIGRLEVNGNILYLVDKDGQRIGSATIEPGLKLEIGDVDESLLSLGDATKATDRLKISIDGDNVCIGGLQQSAMARVFSIGGGLVMSEILNPRPEARLSLAALSNGIYILQINTNIFKIHKK